jgi:hypothetical protein
MLNYEKKYFKYKMKYLELKNQNGGVIFECSFPLKGYNQDTAKLAFEKQCMGENISKEFKLEDLKKAGYTAIHLKAGFTLQQLKAAGYTAIQLKDAEFTPEQLKAAGFTARQLKVAGFNAGQLKAAGFNAEEFRAATFTPLELEDPKIKLQILQSKATKFTPEELKDAEFKLSQLKAAKFTVEEIIQIIDFDNPKELLDAGFSVDDVVYIRKDKNNNFLDEPPYLV